MNDPIVNALSAAYEDMRQRAILWAMAEQQPSNRVHVFLAHSPECKFKAQGLADVLDVSAATVRKVLLTMFGMKADKGWYYWSRPAWMEREADEDQFSLVNQPLLTEPEPDEYATRPMPPYVEPEPESATDPFGVDDGDYDQAEMEPIPEDLEERLRAMGYNTPAAMAVAKKLWQYRFDLERAWQDHFEGGKP